MLGKRVLDEALKRGNLVAPTMGRFGNSRFDDTEFADVDVIINCAGSIPSREKKRIPMIEANTIGPWQLAAASDKYGCHLVHMSTDCVFSGDSGGLWSKHAIPDPIDHYGRTKLAGEPIGDQVTVVRGSFIGPDHGFVRWLLDTKGPITLWTQAVWNGGSVWAMARALVDIAEREPQGLIHVAARKQVSKAWMADYLIDRLGLEFESIEYSEVPKIWRKLGPDFFLPPVEESLNEIVEDLNG